MREEEEVRDERMNDEGRMEERAAIVAWLRENDRRRALKRAYDLTLETQTCDEAVAELVRLTREARKDRDGLASEYDAAGDGGEEA